MTKIQKYWTTFPLVESVDSDDFFVFFWRILVAFPTTLGIQARPLRSLQ